MRFESQTPLQQRRVSLGFGWFAVCHEEQDQSGMRRWLVSAVHPEIMRWEPTDGLPFSSRAEHAPGHVPYDRVDDARLPAAVERLRSLVNLPLHRAADRGTP